MGHLSILAEIWQLVAGGGESEHECFWFAPQAGPSASILRFAHIARDNRLVVIARPAQVLPGLSVFDRAECAA